MVNLGSRLKTLRLQHNMTQKEVADRIGISPAMIGAYENSSRCPSYETLIKLARFFQVTTDYLLGVEQKNVIDLSGLSGAERAAIVQLIKVMQQKYGPFES